MFVRIVFSYCAGEWQRSEEKHLLSCNVCGCPIDAMHADYYVNAGVVCIADGEMINLQRKKSGQEPLPLQQS